MKFQEDETERVVLRAFSSLWVAGLQRADAVGGNQSAARRIGSRAPAPLTTTPAEIKPGDDREPASLTLERFQAERYT